MKLNKTFFLRLVTNAVFFTLPIGLWYGWEAINYGGILSSFPHNVWLSVILAIPLLTQLLGLIISFIDDRFRPFVYGSLIPILYRSGMTLYNLGMSFYYKMYKVAPYMRDTMPVKWIKIQKMGDIIMQFDVLTFTIACVGLTLTRLMVVAMWKKTTKHDLFKGDDKQQLEDGPWQAGFMEKKKVKYLASSKKGVPLGIMPQELGLGKGKIARLPSKPKKEWIGAHHLVISATRGGKGVSCVLPALLDHNGPVAVIDIKGELIVMTKRYRESLGRKVVVLNLYDEFSETLGKNSVHWNPLDFIRPDHFDRDVSAILDGLVEKELGENVHFSDSVKSILREGILYLKQSKPDCFHLPGLYDLIFEKELDETLREWAESDKPEFRRLVDVARTILAAGPNEKGGFKTTLLRSVGWIRFDECKKYLTRSSFSIEEILDNKADLYCVMPADMFEAMDRFMRLFTNIILTGVLRRGGKIKKEILMMLDEFTNIGRLPNLHKMITLGAGYGIEIFLATQNKSSIEEVWGRNGTNTIISNCNVRTFNLGRLDVETASSISAAMGNKTVITHSKNSSESEKNKNQGESYSQTSQKLMETVDILEMKTDTMICMLRSQKTLILNRIISHEHPAYKHKLDTPPLVLT